jgi:hypothetical protein
MEINVVLTQLNVYILHQCFSNFFYSQNPFCEQNFFRNPLDTGTKQTLQEKTVGFLPWEIIKKLWDFLVLFFSTPPLINYGIFIPILF